ncbi:MAG TPA: hypothetical protein VI072_21405 [Polyangiaceae bacterium]
MRTTWIAAGCVCLGAVTAAFGYRGSPPSPTADARSNPGQAVLQVNRSPKESDPALDTPEGIARRTESYFRELDQFRLTGRADPAWQNRIQAAIASGVKGKPGSRTTLSEISCDSRVCRVDARHDSFAHRDAFVAFLLSNAFARAGELETVNVFKPPGELRTSVYLGRAGVVMPRSSHEAHARR